MYKEKKTFKGFEVWWHEKQMSLKMYAYIAFAFFAVQFLLTTLVLLIFKFKITVLTFKALATFHFGVALKGIKHLTLFALPIFCITTLIWIWYPKVLKRFQKKTEEIIQDRHLRGTRFVSEDDLKREVEKKIQEEPEFARNKKKITLGNIPVPFFTENRHFLIVGRSGTGKTTLLNQVIATLRERKEKAIIYDFKGDYLSLFYDPETDYIFNPLDERTVHWCLFREISALPDIDSVATSFIPPSYDRDKFWTNAARDIFVSILYYLYITGNRTNQAIWEMVNYSSEELLEIFESAINQNIEYVKRGITYLKGSDKSAVSSDTLATLKEHTSCFEYMAHLEDKFSLKEWISKDESSFLFITNYSNIRDALRPILSLMIDLTMKHLLSLPEDVTRRRFIIIDEFASLQKLPSIVSCLEQGRSKGASLWLAMQDISQLQRIYGHETTNTITNNTNTVVSFALTDPNSQRYIAELIGETEILETDESLSMGPEDHRDGLTIQRRRKKELLLLPSQIGLLPDFHFYLKMQSFNVTLTRVPFRKFEKKHEPLKFNPKFTFKEVNYGNA